MADSVRIKNRPNAIARYRHLYNESFQANIQVYLAAMAPHYRRRPQRDSNRRTSVNKFYGNYTSAEGDDGTGGTARLDRQKNL